MSDTKAVSTLVITAERLEKMKPVITSGQGHPLAASLMSLATFYDIGAQACRLVQRLAEMDPATQVHWCFYCGVRVESDYPHRPNCIWLLARQLAEKEQFT